MNNYIIILIRMNNYIKNTTDIEVEMIVSYKLYL
jgi:hypothetical protein